jgi:hypothetical protein
VLADWAFEGSQKRVTRKTADAKNAVVAKIAATLVNPARNFPLDRSGTAIINSTFKKQNQSGS